MTSQLELMMGSPVSGFHLAIAGSALQAGNAVGRGRSQAGKSQFRKKAFYGAGILNPYPQNDLAASDIWTIQGFPLRQGFRCEQVYATFYMKEKSYFC